MDGEGLLTGLPRIEEEQRPLGCLFVHPSLAKVRGLGFVEAKRRVVGGLASTGWAAM